MALKDCKLEFLAHNLSSEIDLISKEKKITNHKSACSNAERAVIIVVNIDHI